MIQALLGPLGSLASTWLQGKMDKSKAETEVKVAKAKAEAKVFETEATSQMLNERHLTDQMGDSWKDEFWSLIFGAILICCFIPGTQPYVIEGFIFLDEHTPTWFANMLYIVIGSSFGYRFGKQGLQLVNRRVINGSKKN